MSQYIIEKSTMTYFICRRNTYFRETLITCFPMASAEARAPKNTNKGNLFFL